MTTINYIASIFGFSMVVIPLSLLVNPKNLEKTVKHLEDESNSFLWGIIAFVIGLAMLLNYNVWESNWTVIVTLLGWISLLKGVALLFWPGAFKAKASQIIKSPQLSVWLVVVVFIGLALSYFAFTA